MREAKSGFSISWKVPEYKLFDFKLISIDICMGEKAKIVSELIEHVIIWNILNVLLEAVTI